eukprot:m.32310 g.32310  ORF g.32310 m.32310 type:complete len:725 (+) comp16624_c0_seq1:182-2356(+)
MSEVPPGPPPPPNATVIEPRLSDLDSIVIGVYFFFLLSIAFVQPAWLCLPRKLRHRLSSCAKNVWHKCGGSRGHKSSKGSKQSPPLLTRTSPTSYNTESDLAEEDDDVNIVDSAGGVEEKDNNADTSSYFLADHEMGMLAVSASLFSSNIGSEHFIGLAGDGARGGLAVAGYELSAGFMLVLLGWVFAPIYLQMGVFTMPEFLKKRFGSDRLRLVITVVSLALYAFTKLAASLYAAGLILEFMLGWNVYVAAIAMVVATGVYTAVGGLRTVVYTECFQTVILLLGGLVVAGISLTKVHGLEGLKSYVCDGNTTTWNATSQSCQLYTGDDGNFTSAPLSTEHLHLLRPVSDPDYPWTGMMFGMFCSSLWYWCCDQEIVQRTLCAKDERNARLGCIGAAFLKITPMFMMVVPGMVAQALFPEDLDREGTDLAYPIIVTKLLPDGLVGLVTAAMLSALMSTLASVFNSSATLFTMDIWKKCRPKTSERGLVFVGRCTVVGMCVVSILWLPIIKGSSSLFMYVQSVSNYLAPPITCIFIAAVFVPAIDETAAISGLISGEVAGLLRLVLEITKRQVCEGLPDCKTLDNIFVNMNFLHFALANTVLVWAVMITICIYKKCRRQKSADLLRNEENSSNSTSTFSPIFTQDGDDSSVKLMNSTKNEKSPSLDSLEEPLKPLYQVQAQKEDWKPGLWPVVKHIGVVARQEPVSLALSIGIFSITLGLYVTYH